MTELMVPSDRALASRTESLLLEPARRAGYDLPVIGTSEAPQGEFLWQAPTKRWWVFNDHKSDPTAAQYGGVVVPADVRERLTQLLATGFAPDIILIGHEMHDGWSPGDAHTDLVPVPQQPNRSLSVRSRPHPSSVLTSPRSQDLGRGALTIGKAALKGGIALGIGVGAVVAAVAASAAQLDPIIVAGTCLPGTNYVTWVEVARWEW